MTQNKQKSFQNSATVSRNFKTNIHYFANTSLSFKIRTKIGVCILANPGAIFQSFLLELLGVIHSSMTGNSNPKLSRDFKDIAI